jgi:hypothetical protein
MEIPQRLMLIRFHITQFDDRSSFPKGWHLVNNASGQQGEFSLCGVAFDGDAVQGFGRKMKNAEYKNDGKVTCKNCIAIIKLCKQAKY